MTIPLSSSNTAAVSAVTTPKDLDVKTAHLKTGDINYGVDSEGCGFIQLPGSNTRAYLNSIQNEQGHDIDAQQAKVMNILSEFVKTLEVKEVREKFFESIKGNCCQVELNKKDQSIAIHGNSGTILEPKSYTKLNDNRVIPRVCDVVNDVDVPALPPAGSGPVMTKLTPANSNNTQLNNTTAPPQPTTPPPAPNNPVDDKSAASQKRDNSGGSGGASAVVDNSTNTKLAKLPPRRMQPTDSPKSPPPLSHHSKFKPAFDVQDKNGLATIDEGDEPATTKPSKPALPPAQPKVDDHAASTTTTSPTAAPPAPPNDSTNKAAGGGVAEPAQSPPFNQPADVTPQQSASKEADKPPVDGQKPADSNAGGGTAVKNDTRQPADGTKVKPANTDQPAASRAAPKPLPNKFNFVFDSGVDADTSSSQTNRNATGGTGLVGQQPPAQQEASTLPPNIPSSTDIPLPNTKGEAPLSPQLTDTVKLRDKSDEKAPIATNDQSKVADNSAAPNTPTGAAAPAQQKPSTEGAVNTPPPGALPGQQPETGRISPTPAKQLSTDDTSAEPQPTISALPSTDSPSPSSTLQPQLTDTVKLGDKSDEKAPIAKSDQTKVADDSTPANTTASAVAQQPIGDAAITEGAKKILRPRQRPSTLTESTAAKQTKPLDPRLKARNSFISAPRTKLGTIQEDRTKLGTIQEVEEPSPIKGGKPIQPAASAIVQQPKGDDAAVTADTTKPPSSTPKPATPSATATAKPSEPTVKQAKPQLNQPDGASTLAAARATLKPTVKPTVKPAVGNAEAEKKGRVSGGTSSISVGTDKQEVEKQEKARKIFNPALESPITDRIADGLNAKLSLEFMAQKIKENGLNKKEENFEPTSEKWILAQLSNAAKADPSRSNQKLISALRNLDLDKITNRGSDSNNYVAELEPYTKDIREYLAAAPATTKPAQQPAAESPKPSAEPPKTMTASQPASSQATAKAAEQAPTTPKKEAELKETPMSPASVTSPPQPSVVKSAEPENPITNTAAAPLKPKTPAQTESSSSTTAKTTEPTLKEAPQTTSSSASILKTEDQTKTKEDTAGVKESAKETNISASNTVISEPVIRPNDKTNLDTLAAKFKQRNEALKKLKDNPDLTQVWQNYENMKSDHLENVRMKNQLDHNYDKRPSELAKIESEVDALEKENIATLRAILHGSHPFAGEHEGRLSNIMMGLIFESSRNDAKEILRSLANADNPAVWESLKKEKAFQAMMNSEAGKKLLAEASVELNPSYWSSLSNMGSNVKKRFWG